MALYLLFADYQVWNQIVSFKIMDIEFENKYENKPNFAGFNVIGVGLPGTGEASMKWALSWLLEGACYDITKYLHHGVQQRKVLHKYIIYCNNIRYHFKSNVHHDHLPLYCKRHFATVKCCCRIHGWSTSLGEISTISINMYFNKFRSF